MNKETRFRLRPSVSLVPLGENLYEFFLSSTRRRRRIAFTEHTFVELLSCLDGSLTVAELLEEMRGSKRAVENLVPLLRMLREWCIIEDAGVAAEVRSSPWRRVLNFLSDYFADDQIFGALALLQQAHVVVVGLGAMGSWVCTMLAQTGIRSFVLVDADTVEASNLNRSLYSGKDIGHSKTYAVARHIRQINSEASCQEWRAQIMTSDDFRDVLEASDQPSVVINCADYPTVDDSSRSIAEPCMQRKIPHIISGGYNLHLGLIGPTIIPLETACFECINKDLDAMNVVDLVGMRKLFRPSRNIGSIGPLVGISASFVVNETVRTILRGPSLWPRMLNRRGEFNFFTNELDTVDLPRRDDCPWCGASGIFAFEG